ncbi:MAG: hypothetical protein J0I54_17810 [Bosea sp.]|uniref:hypothetical protein n=1 Tax=unclassified Bosea (in: a-proteobacteria) TaxID=2653178 RepID=UPI0009656C92|nr:MULTISPECIES: hypothetical protein [unclassified Bosea (in: a-proteobacteria)]MBN9458490.1 hypothetical protein [Bosea sp. (in: a-proteobacteria)]OJV06808.1 MAG: hypothetical protein BGO20_00135 [Bosea sp. 67-29]
MAFKAEPVSTEHSGFTTDLSQVGRSPDLGDVLMSNAVSINMCPCCGRIHIGGHDRRGLQFVALPVDASVARAIAANLVEFAVESEKLAGSRLYKH